MGITIAVMNDKGGGGKTSSTINFAAALKRQGKSVLVVDTDPQGDIANYLDLDPFDLEEEGKTLTFGLLGAMQYQELVIHKEIDIIPCYRSIDPYHDAEYAIDYNSLRELLLPARLEYDYIVIDTPPTNANISRLALTAADYSLIIVEPAKLATKGVQRYVARVLQEIPSYYPQVKLLGVVINKYQRHHKNDQEFTEAIQTLKEYGLHIFPPIVASTKFRKAETDGESIFQRFQRFEGARVYEEIARYVITLLRTSVTYDN